MVYGVVLAGGIGSRMGNVDRPKQYLHIGKKPIIVHTVEKFIINDNFEKVIVLCPAQWITYTKDLFRKHLPENSNVVVIEGGKDRNGTIMNAIRYIEETDGLNEETSLVTHDAVRPFVTHQILEESVESVRKGIACDTVIPATEYHRGKRRWRDHCQHSEPGELLSGTDPAEFPGEEIQGFV